MKNIVRVGLVFSRSGQQLYIYVSPEVAKQIESAPQKDLLMLINSAQNKDACQNGTYTY